MPGCPGCLRLNSLASRTAALAALVLLGILMSATRPARSAPMEPEPSAAATHSAPRTDDAAVPGAEAWIPIPEPSADALRYHREGRWLWIVGRLWGLALPAVILLTGLSTRLRDAAWSLSSRVVPDATDATRVRRGTRWLLAVGAFGLVYLVLTALATWPLSYIAGFVRPHAYGLSNQSFARWLAVWATDVAVGLALSLPALWFVYALIERFPRRWWLAVGLTSFPVGLLMAWVMPVFIDPLYHDFGPMRNPTLEARILALADRLGIEGSRVFEVDMSRDTRAVNAYVTGFLGTKRIVLWDTLLDRLDDNEVLAVMAHELGHYVLGHVVGGLLVGSILTLIGLYAVHLGATWMLRRHGSRRRISRLGDIASLPLLILLGRLVALAIVPVGYAYSRHIEHEADRFALELTRSNRAVATAFVALQRENLSHPRPGWFDTALRSTHPSLGHRIHFANTYRPWLDGEPLRYGHLFSNHVSAQPQTSDGRVVAESPNTE